MKSSSSGTRAGQSVRDQLGEGGGGEVNGCESIIWTGTWSEPLEGTGSVPYRAKGKQRRGSKGKIKDRRSAGAAKGKAAIDARLIEKAKA